MRSCRRDFKFAIIKPDGSVVFHSETTLNLRENFFAETDQNSHLRSRVYNIPIYQLLGGKWRDKIRIYADTPEADTPQEFAAIAKEHKDRGLTWIKVDVGTDLLKGKPGTIMEPADQHSIEYDKRLPHPFTGNELTDKDIAVYCEYIATIREAIGYDTPLSTDHLGHLGVKSIIRLGRAYEKYNLEWMEDVIPWWYTDLLKQITNASPTPTLTGEDIYELADFEKLCSNHAVNKIHPDLSTSGGILRTHKIGDMAINMACRWRCTSRAHPSPHCQCALRGGHAKFPRPRKPLARCSLVAGPCRWSR